MPQQHGTDSFTSPPKEDMLRIFKSVKIQRLQPGLSPQPWVPEGARPPKPYAPMIRVMADQTTVMDCY
jgi:hypothetical protein